MLFVVSTARFLSKLIHRVAETSAGHYHLDSWSNYKKAISRELVLLTADAIVRLSSYFRSDHSINVYYFFAVIGRQRTLHRTDMGSKIYMLRARSETVACPY